MKETRVELNAVFLGGPYHNQTMTHQELMKVGNGSFMEDCSELRSRGHWCHRMELDNQPKVNGYVGPMWDGGRLRYETQEMYNMLSR